MCSAMKSEADEACGGKLVLLLEGGYDVDALARSVHACLEVMSGLRTEDFPTGVSAPAARAIADSRQALSKHWRF
jgi:acetoin utilization deacetylase AcuC-like enzyme